MKNDNTEGKPTPPPSEEGKGTAEEIDATALFNAKAEYNSWLKELTATEFDLVIEMMEEYRSQKVNVDAEEWWEKNALDVNTHTGWGYAITKDQFLSYPQLAATPSEKLSVGEEVYVPCPEDDQRACGSYISTDGRSLCYLRLERIPIKEGGYTEDLDLLQGVSDQFTGKPMGMLSNGQADAINDIKEYLSKEHPENQTNSPKRKSR